MPRRAPRERILALPIVTVALALNGCREPRHDEALHRFRDLAEEISVIEPSESPNEKVISAMEIVVEEVIRSCGYDPAAGQEAKKTVKDARIAPISTYPKLTQKPDQTTHHTITTAKSVRRLN